MSIVAVDIGGTFTDLVAIDRATGRLSFAKTLSTPPHFEQGLLNALREASIQPASIEALRHGTTVVINALLERKGAKTALITTEGFRDLLEIGRGNRAQAFNVLYRRLPPFVPRSLRFEVKEDGRHTLFLSDLSGAARPGLGAAYSLVLRRSKPGFSLVAANEPPIEKADDRQIQPRGAVLRAGGTASLRVLALRSDGFDKDIFLSAEGLPPGVSCATTRIPAGKNEGVLLLRTEAGVARNLTQVKITGRSEDGKVESVARGATARWLVPDYNNGAGEVRLTRGEGVAVATSVTAAPLVLTPEVKEPLEVEAGAKVEVALKVSRTADFKEALKIKSAGFAGAETIKEVDADAKAEQVKVTLDLAALKLQPGNHTAYFTTQSKAKVAGRDVTTTAYSWPVQIVVRAPAPKPAPAPPATAPAKEPAATAAPPAAK